MKPKEKGKIRIGIAQILYKLSGFAGAGDYDFLREFHDYDYLHKKNPGDALKNITNDLSEKHFHTISRKINQFRDRLERYYYEWISEKAKKILEVAAEYRIELLVFPELSIPAACLLKIKEETGRGMIVVAGSHYVKGEDINSGVYKDIGLELPPESKNMNLCPIFLSSGEIEYLTKGKMSAFEPYELRNLKIGSGPMRFSIRIYNEDYRFAAFICNDYLVNHGEFRKKWEIRREKEKEQNNIDFFIVVASTPKLERFENAAIEDASDPYYTPVILANNAIIGGSTIYATFDKRRIADQRCEKNRFQPIPAMEEALLLVDIDVKNQKLSLTRSPEGTPLPTEPPIVIPLYYDEKNIQDEQEEMVGYQEVVKKLIQHNFDYDIFAKYFDDMTITQLSLKSRTLGKHLGQLKDDPTLYRNMEQAAIRDFLEAIIFPAYFDNLFEWNYGSVFRFCRFLKVMMRRDNLTRNEKDEIDNLIKNCERWQQSMMGEFNNYNYYMREKFIRAYSLQDIIFDFEAFEKIIEKGELNEDALKKEIKRLAKSYKSPCDALGAIYLDYYPEDKDKRIIG